MTEATLEDTTVITSNVRTSIPNKEQYKCPPMSFKPRRSMCPPGTEILLKKILRSQTLRIRRLR